MTKTLQEYYQDGLTLSDNGREQMEKDLLDEYLANMEDNEDTIREALTYLLTEMGNGDILRAHDEKFRNRWRR